MRVHEVMSGDVLEVASSETFEGAARRMVERGTLGALVERGADDGSPGIVTARDVLELVAERHDPATTAVRERFTPEPAAGAPDWSLERAAETMVEGGFRHLVVAERGETGGVISIRDIVGAWIRERAWRRIIHIREAVNRDFPTLGGDDSLQEAAERMAEQRIGAAVVLEGQKGRPEIITERDLLVMVAAGERAAAERARDHLSERMTYSAPDWSLKQAAEAMIKGGFQHVVVVDQDGTVGIIAMRDILRRWLD